MVSGSGPFKVDRVPKVDEQIEQLEKAATGLGIRQSFFASLKAVMNRLESSPQDFGDPLYRTKHQDGIVCHAMHSPLMVHYALFEKEKTVIILDIMLLTKE
jgi:hypothetical protein